MKSEQEIKKMWKDSDDEFIEKLSALLSSHTYSTFDILARCVAEVCDVKEKDIFSSAHLPQAKSLFWFAYKKISGATYAQMSKIAKKHGSPHHWRILSRYINLATSMVTEDEEWARRWRIINTIIKYGKEKENKKEQYVEKEYTLTIKVPQNLKGLVDIKVK